MREPTRSWQTQLAPTGVSLDVGLKARETIEVVMVIILLSANAATLENALSCFERTATVEAEYGEVLVSGTVETLAHHGSRSFNPAPCVHANVSCELDAIGLSHCDLDALGGTLALLNQKPECDGFWALAGAVDVSGVHKLSTFGASVQNIARLHAWWAWSDKHKMFAPRVAKGAPPPPAVEVSGWIEEARVALEAIVKDDQEMLEAGEEYRIAGERLNTESFVSKVGNVIVRSSESFCNHIYTTPSGDICKAVVNLSPKGTLTVSLADKILGFSVGKILSSLFGPLAGGSDGIGGGDRAAVYTEADVERVIEELQKVL